MTTSLIFACFWVLAATLTALLPMRLQMVPGLILLVSAPAILIWIGYENGWVWTVLALLAFLSMFRNPLKYLWRRARGEKPEIPDELRR